MILVDTSVWIDHLRSSNSTLSGLLGQRLVLTHPWVIGEFALGTLRSRQTVLALLNELPRTTLANDDEVLSLIERRRLFGSGIGYVDAQLLAATLLTPGSALWTLDHKLASVAARVGIDASKALN